MRILAVADLHYNLQQFDWLLAHAAEFDLVVIAGDLLDLAGHAELDAQIVVVSKYLNKLRAVVPALVCSGNHDGDARNENNEVVAQWLLDAGAENLHVDGQSARIGEDLFSVCPWWDGPVTREALALWLDEEGKKPRRRWIWIYHAPPADSPVAWANKKFAGDAFLNELAAKHLPDLVISGHIHNAPFLTPQGSWIERRGRTWHFNPGHVIGAEPPRVILDTETLSAQWISYQGISEANLAGAG